MKKVQVTITGNKPLLMHKFGAEEGTTTVQRGKKDYGTPREQAEKVAYHRDGKLFIPFTWISGAIKHVAGSFRSSINKKLRSLKGLVGGAVLVEEDEIYFNENLTIDQIEVHSVGAVVQRARIMRHRPKLNKWSATFTLSVDDSLVTVEETVEMLKDAGQRAGIGDFRISKGGPYGTFEVTDVNVL